MRSAPALLGADVLLRGSVRQYVVLRIDPGTGEIEAHGWSVECAACERAARALEVAATEAGVLAGLVCWCLFDQARYTRKRARRDRRKEGRQIVRAIARDTTIPHGPRGFNIKYWTRCKIYTAQDVSYAPDLTLPVVKLSELTRGGGPCRPSAMPVRSKRSSGDWGRRQKSLL